MILLFKVLKSCFQLVYQTVFILDECSVPVNFPQQFHYNINVALIVKIYLFSWLLHFFNCMDDFIQVGLETIFYKVSVIYLPHIFLGFNYLPLLPLNYLVTFIDDIFNMFNDFICRLSYHINITLNWRIYFIYEINIWHCLTLQMNFDSLFITVRVTRLFCSRLNKYFFVYYFIVFLFFRVVIQFF